MAVVDDILRTYKGPGRVMRGLLAMGRREDRALMFLMAACGLIFVAQWPRLARAAQETDRVLSLQQEITYYLLAWLIMWPLIFYGVAALSHLLARLIGGQGSHYTARLALFWALLASTPLALLYGLTAGFIGPGLQTNLIGALWLMAFAGIWTVNLRVAQGPDGAGI